MYKDHNNPFLPLGCCLSRPGFSCFKRNVYAQLGGFSDGWVFSFLCADFVCYIVNNYCFLGCTKRRIGGKIEFGTNYPKFVKCCRLSSGELRI